MNEDYQTAILLLTVNYLPNMKRAEIPRVSAFDILFQFSFPKPGKTFACAVRLSLAPGTVGLTSGTRLTHI